LSHLAAWNYFRPQDTEENAEFRRKNGRPSLGCDETAVTNDPWNAHYIGLQHVGQKLVEKAGTKLILLMPLSNAIHRCLRTNLTVALTMMPNHHITKPVLIGEIQEDGQFETCLGNLRSRCCDAWSSDYLPELQGSDFPIGVRQCLAGPNFNTATRPVRR